MQRRRSLMVIAIAVLGIAACTGGESAAPTTAPTPETTAATTPTAATTAPRGEVDWSEIDTVVTDAIAEYDLNGAGLVLVDGDTGVVDERYWGELGPDRVSLIASSTKMITATVIMALATDGTIDFDAPIADQVSWTGGNPTITFADALSSQSGLVGLTPNPLYPPYLCQLKSEGTIAECARQIDTTPDDDRDTLPPNVEFHYGGGQWQLAGGAAVDISGKSWAELVDEYLIEPCDVNSLGYTNHWAEFGTGFRYPSEWFNGDVADLPVTDNPSMEGGAYINPPDYAKLISLHLNDGRCGDTQVVDPALIERAHTDQTTDENISYGYGWLVGYDGTIHDPGAFGSAAWLDLEHNDGAWFVIEENGTVGDEILNDLRPLLEQALATP